MPGLDIGRGNIFYDMLIYPSLTPVAVAQNISAEQTFTIAGLQVNDYVDVKAQVAQTAGIVIGNSRVTAPNTLSVSFGNLTGGALTPAAGVYTVNVNRPFSPPLAVNMA